MSATSGGGGGGGEGYSFPVVFNDGELETNIGNILVSPNTDFKSFQTTISTKIGISQNQFTTFLKHQNQPSRKIPITSKINFAAVLQDTKYYFLVSLKRHKPTRTLKNINSSFSSPNVVLLRRGESVNGFYEMRLKALQLEKERFLVNMRQPQDEQRSDCCSVVVKKNESGNDVVCEECLKGGGGEFHWCVLDAVVDHRFMSPAGPISRPVRTRQ